VVFYKVNVRQVSQGTKEKLSVQVENKGEKLLPIRFHSVSL
jgi:hypothetical protein